MSKKTVEITKRRPTGKVICAWCGEHLGEKEGIEGVSHTICKSCKEEEMKEDSAWMDKLKRLQPKVEKLQEIKFRLLYELVQDALELAVDEREMNIDVAWRSDQAEEVATRAIDLLEVDLAKLEKAIRLMKEDSEVVFMYLRQPYGIVFGNE